MIDCLEKQHLIASHQQLQLMASGGGGSANANGRDPYLQQQQQQLIQRPSPEPLVYPQPPEPLAVASFQSPQQQQSGNELIGYYFGSISRETAEWILRNHGGQMDGAYLLRSSGPNDDFVLSLMVNHQVAAQEQQQQRTLAAPMSSQPISSNLEVLHYKIVETEDSFVALHGQVGDEKFATIDELIDKAQGVATKPRWPIQRQTLESQILPPTYWGLSVDQVRLAILIKAKQWGFPLLSSLFQQQDNLQQQQKQQTNNGHTGTVQCNNNLEPPATLQQVNGPSAAEISVTTLNNETIRTLVYKSLHEFQPWFHGKITRDEAERRIELGISRDGRFLVRERDNYSYAMCISHKRTTKHYRIDVLPTGELAIQDGRKFTSLMALVSHYTIMSDGLWCALTEACPRPINGGGNFAIANQTTGTTLNNGINNLQQFRTLQANGSVCYGAGNSDSTAQQQNLYCVPPIDHLSNSLRNNRQTTSMLPLGTTSANASSNDNSHQSLTSFHHHHQQQQLALNQHHHLRQQLAGHQPSADGTTGNFCNSVTQAETVKGGQSQQQMNLICAHQGAVASLKAPIREWLQTINHKWSQLINSKNQHQSLNSFLFGNQNPLNNHCRYSSRDHHHRQHHHHHHHPAAASVNHDHQQMRHRKCKNGHASCACIHQMLADRAATLSGCGGEPMKMDTAGQLEQAGGQASFNRRDIRQETGAEVARSFSGNCCANSLAFNPRPVAGLKQRCLPIPGQVPNNSPIVQNNSNNNTAAAAATFAPPEQNGSITSDLLSRLPQNSGFTLNSQSFIGSPLFAVKTAAASAQQQTHSVAQLERNQSLTSAGGSGGKGSSSGSGGQEERLISPVQSVTGNLNGLVQGTGSSNNNNPYALNQNSVDIYGSQTSTALVNDQQMMSSSSSSGTQQRFSLQQSRNNLISNNNNNLSKLQQQPTSYGVAKVSTPQFPAAPRHAGPILCGQHAGPAYRYTNCSNDENRQCSHRPPPHLPFAQRAADDSQLATGSSTQLAYPTSAMAKFVQFQDGQCLRTHRDTRSIQMAYLSSRPSSGIANLQQQLLNNQSSSRANNQVPLRELNGRQRQRQDYGGQQFYLTSKNKATINGQFHEPASNYFTSTSTDNSSSNNCKLPQQNSTNSMIPSADLMASGHQIQQQQRMSSQSNHLSQWSRCFGQENNNNNNNNRMNGGPLCNEIDLMDCGEDCDDPFDFKYDPKLIKSSSIETLCEIGKDNSSTNRMLTADHYEDELEAARLDSLVANCKSNSELMMSLQSCWLTANQQQQRQQPTDILSPIQMMAEYGNGSLMKTKDDNNNPVVEQQTAAQQNGASSILSSLLPEEHEQLQIEHDIKKKHDLDELTTALLAELTASLKAQVDLKNRRSGFNDTTTSSNSISQHNSSSNNLPDSSNNNNNNRTQQGAASSNSHQRVEAEASEQQVNPLELINEFDTLISSGSNNIRSNNG